MLNNAELQKAAVMLSGVAQCRKEPVFLPDNLRIFADDVQLEHVSALHALYEPERHLQGETKSVCVSLMSRCGSKQHICREETTLWSRRDSLQRFSFTSNSTPKNLYKKAMCACCKDKKLFNIVLTLGHPI